MTTPTTTPAAAPAATGDQQADDYSTFSDVFAGITEGAAQPAAGAGTSTDITATDEAAAAAKAAETPAPAAAPAAETPPAAAEGDKSAAPPVPSQPSPADGVSSTDSPAPQPGEQPPAEDDYEARFKALSAQFEELKNKVNAPPAETPPAAAPTAAPAAAEAPPIYAAEEIEFLKKYDEDWPDIARGEALKRRAEYQELVTHVFKEVARVYGPMVKEAYEAAQVVNDNTQLDGIRRVHSDYDAIYDDVVKWTDTLPAYVKGRAKEVMESGTVEEVNSMITDFKKATGRVAQPTTPTATTPPAATPAPAAAGVAQLSDAAKKAAKAMGAVDSKRTAGAAADDPNDFDGAWASINQAA